MPQNGLIGDANHKQKHDKLLKSRPPMVKTRSTVAPEAVNNISTLPRGLCKGRLLPKAGGGGSGKARNVVISIYTDDNPLETSWILKDSSGKEIKRRKPGFASKPDRWFPRTLELRPGSYRLILQDKGGNGIWSDDEGHGKYKISSNGKLVKSGVGRFKHSLSVPFTIA